jgi:hypothetical protein
MSDVLRVQWTIIPGSAPEPWLNCNRCRGTTRFRTSGKIRVNANGKRVDAWLIYKCTLCDNTWNRPVLERRHVSTIDPHLLASLQTNDPDLSRRLAFETLRPKLKVEHFDDATVCKEVVSESARPADRLEIVCVVPETTGLRVDRLLSTELGLSRSRIQNMQNAGHLAACPDGLRRPLRNGLRVRIELRGVHDGDKIAFAATAARNTNRSLQATPRSI